MVEIEAGLSVVTGPVAEPVTLAEAKLWSRVASSGDDAIFNSLITAARLRVESAKDGSLVQATYLMTLDQFPVVWWTGIGSSGAPMPQIQGAYSGNDFRGLGVIRLKRGPLVSVTSIQYVDVAGVLQTLAPTLYQVDATTPGGRVLPAFGKVWPATRGQAAAVQITYVAGYSATPETFKTAVKILVAWMYENRGDAQAAGLPESVEALLDSFGSGRST